MSSRADGGRLGGSAPTEETGGLFSLTEFHAVEGPASPLHVHRNEGEWWYVLEGTLAVWAGGQLIQAPGGTFVLGPAGVPHTFSVTSAEARFLLGTAPAGFEAFLRTCAEPAQCLELPGAGVVPPSPERLTQVAAEHGIEILGPPGIPA